MAFTAHIVKKHTHTHTPKQKTPNQVVMMLNDAVLRSGRAEAAALRGSTAPILASVLHKGGGK